MSCNWHLYTSGSLNGTQRHQNALPMRFHPRSIYLPGSGFRVFFCSLHSEFMATPLRCDKRRFAVSSWNERFGRIGKGGGHPVAFMASTLSKHEQNYPDIEWKALTIIESTQKWCSTSAKVVIFLTIKITHKYLSFIFLTRQTMVVKSKVPNYYNVLETWVMANVVRYLPSVWETKHVPDKFSRHLLAITNDDITLCQLHDSLAGIVRPTWRSVPFSLNSNIVDFHAHSHVRIPGLGWAWHLAYFANSRMAWLYPA